MDNNHSSLEMIRANYPVANRIAWLLAFVCYPFVMIARYFESLDHVALLEVVEIYNEKTGETEPSYVRLGWFGKSGRLLHAADIGVTKTRGNIIDIHDPIPYIWEVDVSSPELGQMSTTWICQTLSYLRNINKEITAAYDRKKRYFSNNLYPTFNLRKYA